MDVTGDERKEDGVEQEKEEEEDRGRGGGRERSSSFTPAEREGRRTRTMTTRWHYLLPLVETDDWGAPPTSLPASVSRVTTGLVIAPCSS